MRTSRPWLQLGRSALLFGSTALNFYALRYLQLDQAIAIIFSTPFIVAALGGPILGEWIHWRRWTAIIVGFCGVLLVTRPGAGGIHWAAALSAIGAVCYAIYSISTRILARHDSTDTTNFYSNLVGAILATMIVPFLWTPQSDWRVILLMCSMGLFSGMGHYLLIIGHRLAPASVLAPFIYTEIIWMIALGYVVFGDKPNNWTLAGVAVVIASGLYLLYRERMVGPREIRLIDFPSPAATNRKPKNPSEVPDMARKPARAASPRTAHRTAAARTTTSARRCGSSSITRNSGCGRPSSAPTTCSCRTS